MTPVSPSPNPNRCENWNNDWYIQFATLEDVTTCLRGGANTNASDSRGFTVLHQEFDSFVERVVDVSIIDTLPNAGANPNDAENWDNKFPLHLAARRYNPNRRCNRHEYRGIEQRVGDVMRKIFTTFVICVACVVAALPIASQSDGKNIRFSVLDIYLETAEPLAAWQFELSELTGQMLVVGVENGESTAFEGAPYYDLEAVRTGPLIVLLWPLSH